MRTWTGGWAAGLIFSRHEPPGHAHSRLGSAPRDAVVARLVDAVDGVAERTFAARHRAVHVAHIGITFIGTKAHRRALRCVTHAVFAGAVFPLNGARRHGSPNGIGTTRARIGLHLAVLEQARRWVAKAVVAAPDGAVRAAVLVAPTCTVAHLGRAAGSAQLALGCAIDPCVTVACRQGFAADQTGASGQCHSDGAQQFEMSELMHGDLMVNRAGPTGCNPRQPQG